MKREGERQPSAGAFGRRARSPETGGPSGDTGGLDAGASGIPLLDRLLRWPSRAAVMADGASYGYGLLAARSEVRAGQLLAAAGKADLGEDRVGFVAAPGVEYVVTLYAIWRAGGVAVPLCPEHPRREVEYVVGDAGCSLLVTASGEITPAGPDSGLRAHRPHSAAGAARAGLPRLTPGRRAMILYTSGTTGRPKGAVLTHRALAAQVSSLVEAWRWTPGDRILHVLPLHHTHGIVNALCCPLYTGATVDFAGGFDATLAWERLSSGEASVFMAVPTIYAKLLRAWDLAGDRTKERWSSGAKSLRLAVSGSAALPVRIFQRWKEVAGQPLLERYGMTEAGMALSNPYDGERRAGAVGQPLPGVGVRLVDPATGSVLAEGAERTPPGEPSERADRESGEIQLRGPMLFSEYWKRQEETEAAFADGWFKTGDEATLEEGYYRILGRRSVDIIKSGGYKISAIEIEELLRSHPVVQDCAVVGVPDEEWGERVVAVVVPHGVAEPTMALSGLLEPWARKLLAPYKVPRVWRCVEDLPRNEMGKVQKPELQQLLGSAAEAT